MFVLQGISIGHVKDVTFFTKFVMFLGTRIFVVLIWYDILSLNIYHNDKKGIPEQQH
jgi:hypothetical protein